MQIQRIKVENFRSLESIEILVDDYSVLVGPNGAGKSSILYALSWFFSGDMLEPTDVHVFSSASDDSDSGLASGDVADSETPTVTVTVTFDSLTDVDRGRLAEYGRGETATFSRIWTPGDAKSKTIGNALAGPGFSAIRQMTRVGEFRPAYAKLREGYSALPDLGSTPTRPDVMQALASWESEPANAVHLEPVPGGDASHMFGFNGAHVLRECVRLVLIPAAADIVGDVGSISKGSTLNELIGSLMADAGASARAAWLVEHQEKLDDLNRSVGRSVASATAVQTRRINSRLASLVPNTEVEFTPSVPDWVPKGDPTVTTSVAVNGVSNDIARQGHGVQRAVMIAMFEALAPDEELARAAHAVVEGETEAEADARLAAELEKLPHLVVAIEEPEIYQHPVRARAFARVLSEISQQANVQVLLASHSPYFVRPQQFGSVRRFWLKNNKTEVTHTSIADVAAKAGCAEAQVEKIVAKRLPNTFAEGFFSDVVVLVEGDTDKVVLETVAEMMGTPLDVAGISVLDMSGKEGIAVPLEILNALGIAAYVVADGDGLGYTRKPASRQAQAKASHQQSTETLCARLPMSSTTVRRGALPYSFGDPSLVTDDFTIWIDDVEEELAAWPSFVTELTSAGGELRSKDLLAYRTALLDAEIAELPQNLRACVEALLAFGASRAS